MENVSAPVPSVHSLMSVRLPLNPPLFFLRSSSGRFWLMDEPRTDLRLRFNGSLHRPSGGRKPVVPMTRAMSSNYQRRVNKMTKGFLKMENWAVAEAYTRPEATGVSPRTVLDLSLLNECKNKCLHPELAAAERLQRCCCRCSGQDLFQQQ